MTYATAGSHAALERLYLKSLEIYHDGSERHFLLKKMNGHFRRKTVNCRLSPPDEAQRLIVLKPFSPCRPKLSYVGISCILRI